MSALAEGTVRRLGIKGRVEGERGLPKPSVPAVRFAPQGLEGDYNHYRTVQRGGEPAMAVLLMPEETLAELNREGWPVRPGDLGENVTLQGVPYDALLPGREVRLGGAVVQISQPCTPCDNLYALPYVGHERGPAFLKALLGRRGWFARIVRPGDVRVGDRVEVRAPGP